jgi:hypothetical protein
MKLLKSAFGELLGIFVDDGALAVIVLVLVAVTGLAVRTGYLDALIGAIVLMLGCLLVLVESLARALRSFFYDG